MNVTELHAFLGVLIEHGGGPTPVLVWGGLDRGLVPPRAVPVKVVPDLHDEGAFSIRPFNVPWWIKAVVLEPQD